MNSETPDEKLPEPASDTKPSGGLMSLVYGLVIFISAYLLFQVQPLTSKSILPWFGGTPSVWTTCMLFFQLLLFGGYLYAHLLSSKLSPKAQLITHSVLMLAAITASVLPGPSWKPTGAENPTLQIVMMLAACIGLPFFVLSSTGPLVQNWFSRALPGRSPYHLYSLSNIGSLLGLLLYPFYVEIQYDLPTQGSLWKYGFTIFVVGCAICGLNFAKKTSVDTEEEMGVAEPPTLGKKLLWFMLAAVPSTMLLATTNQVCLDVASIPFLWILPLTIYLLTFILSFAGERWYLRRTCSILLPISLVALIAAMIGDASVNLELQLLCYFSALFLTAMCCHGELVRAKPTPQHLTTFYLWMSAGGAAGGLFVGLVAPMIFDLYLELHVGILAAMILMGIVWSEDPNNRWYEFWKTPGVIFLSLSLSMILLMKVEIDREIGSAMHTSRNFYGVIRIKDVDEEFEFWRRKLINGRILHGTQYLSEERRRWPTTYYSYDTGVGIANLNTEEAEPRHIGVVGLGTGTVAAYGDANDRVTYYEINEDVVRIAGAGAEVLSSTYEPMNNPAGDESYFTYLSDCPGKVRVILGDARLALERAESEQFDVLALDAFSSDAIPAHLLTKEATEVYLRHLKPNGILAVHISNRHFELEPVVAGLAEELNLVDRYVSNDEPESDTKGYAGGTRSEWILLAQSEDAFVHPVLFQLDEMNREKQVLWTDTYSNLFQVLRRKTSSTYKRELDDLLESLHLPTLFREDESEDFDEGDEGDDEDQPDGE